MLPSYVYPRTLRERCLVHVADNFYQSTVDVNTVHHFLLLRLIFGLFGRQHCCIPETLFPLS